METNQPEYIPTDTPTLIEFLQQSSERILSYILDGSTLPFETNVGILGETDYQTLKAVIRDLLRHKADLEPELRANLALLQGRESSAENEWKEAISFYQQCLEFWQPKAVKSKPKNSLEIVIPKKTLEWLGILFFHVGLCHYRLGLSAKESETQSYFKEAKAEFQQCLDILEQAGRQDLVAKFINLQGEVLQHLELWEDLKGLTQKALSLHITYGSESQLAQDYGFLAEAALHTSKWAHANQLAELALAIQTQAKLEEPEHHNSYAVLLEESRQEFNQWRTTVRELEEALSKTDPQQDLKIYLRILKALHKLYFDQDEYREALRIYEKQREIEYEYEVRSFKGIKALEPQDSQVARELKLSGRTKDIQTVLKRLQKSPEKLTVLHGESGVGKTSFIKAGLIPSLQQPGVLQDQEKTLPLVMVISDYKQWMYDLERDINQISDQSFQRSQHTINYSLLLDSLREEAQKQSLVLIIFDQFEEFFFGCHNLSERKVFYNFLGEALGISSVQIILSIQTDALHYLLECEKLANLTTINNDILAKSVRYQLSNLSFNHAQKLTESLMKRSKLHLEPELLDRIMMELWEDEDTIHPVALQMLGYQLEMEGITSLEEYQKLSPHPKWLLVSRYLEELIKHTGRANEKTARLVLFSLTNENGTRLIKTRDELMSDLGGEANKLDLVLDILVKGGLISEIPDLPFNRYHLAHNYLGSAVRHQQGEMLIAELELQRERVQRKLSEEKPNSFLDRVIASFFRWIRSD